MSFLTTLQARARDLKRHTLTVYFAARDPRMPWGARLLALLVAAYALSPIDLIPDFIPVLGLLDDLLLLPLGLALVLRLTPPEVMAAARQRAQAAADKPVSYGAAIFTALLWLAVLLLLLRWLRGA